MKSSKLVESEEMKNIRENVKLIGKKMRELSPDLEAFKKFVKVMGEVGIRLSDFEKRRKELNDSKV